MPRPLNAASDNNVANLRNFFTGYLITQIDKNHHFM